MKLGRTEDAEELEVGAERAGGGGWRRRIAMRQGQSVRFGF